MSKRVILNAMIEPLQPDLLREGDEVWTVSGAFRHQHGVTRVFVPDELSYFPEGFADELNLLPHDVRVLMTRHREEVPRSEPYPIHEVIDYFHGLRFFTSTASLMLALAIYEGFDEVIISGMYWRVDSEEYMEALGCMNFWLGVAMGKGIKVGIHGPCSLVRPHPWQPDLYGYVTNETRETVTAGMKATYIWASMFPYKFIKHVDIDSPDFARIAAGEEVAHAATH